jgi:hypothetical protein
LGVGAEQVNQNRLYRALDEVLPLKEKLEAHLKSRIGKTVLAGFGDPALRCDQYLF